MRDEATRGVGRGESNSGRGRWLRLACFAILSSVAGCLPAEPADSLPDNVTVLTDRMPIPAAYLDRKYTLNQGLLPMTDPDGYPATDGAHVDAAIVETRRYYEAIGTPGRALEPGAPSTPPATFEEWKQAFGFPGRLPDETRSDWRTRAGVVIYYNQYELGLGRELGCTEFEDGPPGTGAPNGVACFVTNYGAAFSDVHNSLAAAIDGGRPKNTVCIAYRPSLGADYDVQFYVFGRDGKRQDWAQLDTMGPRPHPQVCTNCHGGFYDSNRHLVRRARFLPTDPSVLRFADAPVGLTRSAQEERIRRINELALRTPLTTAQRALFEGMYAGNGAATTTAGSTASLWAPAGWSDTAAHRDLYLNVVKPYCGTCHAAMDQNGGGATAPAYKMLDSFASLSGPTVAAYVCSLQMPNAQATAQAFWRPRAGGIAIEGRSYGSAADALLGEAAGADRSLCSTLATMSDCRRGEDPDATCGNRWSGTACDRTTGQCVPQLGDTAPKDPAQPTGVCKMDGSRRCPWPLECRPMSMGIEGFDGGCVH